MITQNELKKILRYYNGDFIRVKDASKGAFYVGDKVGGVNSLGYVTVSLSGKRYYAHRLVWLYHYGYIPENQIDHINRDKQDNRIENLREVSSQCNLRNIGNFKHNTSGVKGVCKHKATGKWSVEVMVDRVRYSAGYFKDFTEAVAHRLAMEQSVNWSGCDSSSPAFKFMRNYIKDSPTCLPVLDKV